MKTTELTDIDGDALTITQRLDATWITCTKGNEEVTIGPVPTDAIRHAFETPMGDDLADGGVTAGLIEREVEARWAADEFADDSTVPPLIAVLDAAPVLGCDGCDECGPAAAIEAEVVSPERARSLVQERDEAIALAEKAERKAEGAAREAERRGQVLVERTRERDDARGDRNDALHREKAEQDRALKAEYERDEARDTAARYLQQRRDAVLRAEKAELKQVEADGALKTYVTAQTSRSARELIEAAWGNGYMLRGGVIPAGADHMLRDPDGLIYIDRADHDLPGYNDGIERLLIDPPAPARPAGAAQLDPLVDRAIRGCSDITTPETVRAIAIAIANGLAEEGVLAPGAQS